MVVEEEAATMWFVVKWSGWGLLVLPLMVLGVAFGAVVQELFDGHPLVTDTGWVVGFLISAALIRYAGNRLHGTLYDVPMRGYAWLGVTCAVLTLAIVVLFRFVWV